jgi:hypothetical protein
VAERKGGEGSPLPSEERTTRKRSEEGTTRKQNPSLHTLPPPPRARTSARQSPPSRGRPSVTLLTRAQGGSPPTSQRVTTLRLVRLPWLDRLDTRRRVGWRRLRRISAGGARPRSNSRTRGVPWRSRSLCTNHFFDPEPPDCGSREQRKALFLVCPSKSELVIMYF